jgi:hypothetical protein
MYQDSRPGRGTLVSHGPSQRSGHSAVQPGKQTRVEQELGSTAAPLAARRPDPHPTVELIARDRLDLDLPGGLRLSETATAIVMNAHGGDVKVSIGLGSLSIGNAEMHVDMNSGPAVRGRHLTASGAGVMVRQDGHHRSELKARFGHIGYEYASSWTITSHHHPWRVELTLATFIGMLPPPPKQPPWWTQVPIFGELGEVLEQALAWISTQRGFLFDTAPEWAPLLLVAA